MAQDDDDENVDEYGKTVMMPSPFFQKKPEGKAPASDEPPIEEQRTRVGRVEDEDRPPSRITVNVPKDEPVPLQQPRAQPRQQASRPQPPRPQPMAAERTPPARQAPRAGKKAPMALIVAVGILLLGAGVGMGVLIMQQGNGGDKAAVTAATATATANAAAAKAAAEAKVAAELKSAETVIKEAKTAEAPNTASGVAAAVAATAPPAPSAVVVQAPPAPSAAVAKPPAPGAAAVVVVPPEPTEKPQTVAKNVDTTNTEPAEPKEPKKPKAGGKKATSTVVVEGSEDAPPPPAKSKKKGFLMVKGPPGIQILIDNKPINKTTPLASAIELDPGPTFVTLISADGVKKSFAMELEPGETQTLSDIF